MEILDLRHLRSRDLEPLLEEQKVLWQKDLRWDYSSSAALIRRYVDACALPGYAAVEGGRAVGYSFYVYENYKGLIGDVYVSDSFGAGTTEAQLLTHVIETLQATPGIRRIEAQLMNLRHQFPCDFSLGQNVQSFRRRFMILPLDDGKPRSSSTGPPPDNGASCSTRISDHEERGQSPMPLPIDEIKLVAWDARWIPEVAQLITRAYRGHVDSAISDQYRSRAGAMRFLDNIIHYPGCGEFDANCSFLAFRKDTSELCGMGLSSVVGDRVSHITQVCVDPELQGAGVGRTLICQFIHKLRERGFSAITLTVTAANTRAVRLYEQFRFSTLKEFPALAWDAPKRETESALLGRG